MNQQPVNVRIYESENRLMVAAPLPGIEPTDIRVTIRDNNVSINGDYRGPLKEDPPHVAAEATKLLLNEWTAGPYYRELTLPEAVDGRLSNATYGNGVLVLVMPKQKPGVAGSAAEFRLEVLDAPRGARVGHTGRDVRSTTTAEHRQRGHS